MRFPPHPTDKHYPTFNALIKDVNETTSRQGCNVVKSGGNKKDKKGVYGRFDCVVAKKKGVKTKEL